ncbi:hypothetical protein EI42_00408 [Thermosporothrix hazakensis]|jgi:hypothetical protein|uniref:Uncharacterized protein n=2 Tax=Thermosporothrix TaxID=768650 RepID=A0A326UE84_THEHA|nr:hypothetical protein [Thermosporothrix hazakensis]PZW36235.1 hypothetical protein EI42_00408 [Thermosporothrix hazakensis]BBH88698.1 hypothetical protein KTC_34490 [Thermosporothrix sp. COM3]GCE46884.1 hypothetical protein KTH_17530 [Thermosporothrix hazakensis]
MRGKLRDKRAANKRDSFKFDAERRRAAVGKRNNRTHDWIRELEEEELELEEELDDEIDDEPNFKQPRRK